VLKDPSQGGFGGDSGSGQRGNQVRAHSPSSTAFVDDVYVRAASAVTLGTAATRAARSAGDRTRQGSDANKSCNRAAMAATRARPALAVARARARARAVTARARPAAVYVLHNVRRGGLLTVRLPA
jgi:hypothetical protein